MVLHQASGKVTTWRVFDTYSTSQESKQLIDFIHSLREGRILCFAVKVGPPVLWLGSMTTIFLKILYIMRYNAKNARNGKSISKISKWPSLKSLVLKSRLICQFEFLENLEYMYIYKMICFALQQLFPYKSS